MMTLTSTPPWHILMKKGSLTPAAWSTISSTPQKNAWARLDAGPASATQTMSRLGLFRLPKRTGTGLAYPNMNAPLVENNNIRGIRIVPTGSMCRIGFSVMRPSL